MVITGNEIEIAKVLGLEAVPLIKKGIDNMHTISQSTYSKVEENFEVMGRKMKIICPEKLQNYSMSLTPKKGRRFHSSKVAFEHGVVRSARIMSLMGFENIDAISLKETGFEVDMSKLSPGEMYLMDITYELDENNFIDSLVTREKPTETPGADDTNFWMVAMLNYADVLNEKFDRIDLEDLDFSVDVGVHQDVNSTMPKAFQDQIDTLARIAGPIERGQVAQEFRRLHMMKSKKYGDSALEMLSKILNVFNPPTFRKFVDVQEDFKYTYCEKGRSPNELPLNWPRFMTVTSRTNLSLQKPTAHGTLVYKKKDLISKLEDILEKKETKDGESRKD